MSLSLIIFTLVAFSVLGIISLLVITCMTDITLESSKLYLLVLISTFIVAFPIKMIASITGVIGISIFSLIASITVAKFLRSIFSNDSLPSLYNIFFSVFFSLVLVFFIYPTLVFFISILFQIENFDFKEYLYILYFTYNVLLDTGIIQDSYMAKRTPETEQLLRTKRSSAKNADHQLYLAFEKYNKELNAHIKKANLIKLFGLLKEQKDLCHEIDSIAGTKSSFNAFKGKSYSKYVANYILSNKKK